MSKEPSSSLVIRYADVGVYESWTLTPCAFRLEEALTLRRPDRQVPPAVEGDDAKSRRRWRWRRLCRRRRLRMRLRLDRQCNNEGTHAAPDKAHCHITPPALNADCLRFLLCLWQRQ